MKSFFAATAALLSVVSASPLAPWEKMAPPPAGTQMYTLQAKSSTAAVNNQYVSLKTGSTSYLLNSAAASASKFFTRTYAPTNTLGFYNGDDTRQIVLQGSDSVLLYLLDAQNPTNDQIPKGQLMEWSTFTMDNNVLGVKDGSTLTNRTFVAVQGTDGAYGLALYDGASTTTAKITPITLNVVKA